MTNYKCKVCSNTAKFKARTDTGAGSEMTFAFCSKEHYDWFSDNQIPLMDISKLK